MIHIERKKNRHLLSLGNNEATSRSKCIVDNSTKNEKIIFPAMIENKLADGGHRIVSIARKIAKLCTAFLLTKPAFNAPIMVFRGDKSSAQDCVDAERLVKIVATLGLEPLELAVPVAIGAHGDDCKPFTVIAFRPGAKPTISSFMNPKINYDLLKLAIQTTRQSLEDLPPQDAQRDFWFKAEQIALISTASLVAGGLLTLSAVWGFTTAAPSAFDTLTANCICLYVITAISAPMLCRAIYTGAMRTNLRLQRDT